MKPRLALLVLAPVLLCAGMCGSVLRGHHPADWPIGPEHDFVRRFGTIEVGAGWLIRRDGSAILLRLSNSGPEPLRVDGIDLETGGRRIPWDGTVDPVPPGGRSSLHPRWTPEVHDARCAVILRTSAGELRIDLVEPP